MHPHLRFRTSTLLSLVVVVAAFFLGRQSDEIGARLAQLWQSIWPSVPPFSYRLVNQPDGSLLIVSQSKVDGVTSFDQQVIRVDILDANQVKIAPQADGNSRVTVWQYDRDTQAMNLVKLDLVVDNHRIAAAPSSNPQFPEPAK
jgi:hypothetical protein